MKALLRNARNAIISALKIKTIFEVKKFFIFIAFIFSVSFLSASEKNLNLKDNFSNAQSGDFVIFVQNKNMTLFHVFEAKDNNHLIIEEISAPFSCKSKIKNQWQDWIYQKAPGHSSWIMYDLDLANLKIEDVYSYSQNNWQQVYAQEQIFPILMSLNFEAIDTKDRKKAGPPREGGLIDDRPIWQPPVILEGEKISGILSSAYKSYWPKDNSELSGKKIEIYLPNQSENIVSYFPNWIQVSNSAATVKLRVIDSGHNLSSVHKSFPVPPPQLSTNTFLSNGDLKFELKSHILFQNFQVYFKEYGKPFSHTKKIPFQIKRFENSKKLELIISKEDLKSELDPSKLYSFVFEPEEYPHLAIETPKPVKVK